AAAAIRNETRALMRMILNLLDLSRSDEGRLVPQRTSIDLDAHLTVVFEELRPAAAAAGVELVADVAAVRELVVDPSLLQRILTNLVENAIRHAPEGTSVRVSATHVDDATHLRVADQGCGIAEDLRARVFQRFESEGGAQNRGLGLSFCQAAVQAHGGEIWIEDASPGAVFCMRIPDAR
ncbi:MAG: sensor histidine kinase, partial [Kofleriaceae bacterium]